MPEADSADVQMLQQMERLAIRTLFHQLDSIGLLGDHSVSVERWCSSIELPEHYRRWLRESLRVLSDSGVIVCSDNLSEVRVTAARESPTIWLEWSERARSWPAGEAAQWTLLQDMLRALPEILSGQRLATEVMFPASTTRNVEAVYKQNPVADYFNNVLADTLGEYVSARLERDPATRFRILEIGAGTGATSEVIFDRLMPYQAAIAEYCFTDISKVFLLEIARRKGSSLPYLQQRLLDVERPLDGQGIDCSAYDVVLAANVLHATKSVRESLRNAKMALKRDGLLLLYETTAKSLFAHLTFGLLQGWWRFEDAEVRQPGSPLLAPQGWSGALAQEGFRCIGFPARRAEPIGQQIIVALSDGVVRSPTGTSSSAAAAAPAGTGEQSPRIRASGLQNVELDVQQAIIDQLADSLSLAPESIDPDSSFTEYGLDSIMGVKTAEALNALLSTRLSTASLFEHPSVRKLASYIVAEYGGATGFAEAQARLRKADRGASPPWSAAAAASPDMTSPQGPAPSRSCNEPIAIVGISGRFAGARNTDELWQHLQAGCSSKPGQPE